MEPPSLAIDLGKLLLWLTLALAKKSPLKTDGLTGRARSFSLKTLEMGVVSTESGRSF